MRIAIAGIEHETNTYCQGVTTQQHFVVQRGQKMLQAAGQETQLGGAVDACIAHGIEPIPLLHAWTQPSGIIDRDSYLVFKNEILDGLATQPGIDGCLLLLHGAGVVDGIPDLEADLAEAIRAQLGPGIPMAACFDLHGNISQAMADQLNAVFACHHYPHTDQHERAAEAIQVLQELATSGKRPHCKVVRAPLLLPTTTTLFGIGEQMFKALKAQEAEHPELINVSWFHGFPYCDVAHIGSSICVTGYGETPAKIAGKSALALWQERESFRVESLDADAAVANALAANNANETNRKGPVVIHETSDNCGAGTPGDGTHLLRAMLDANLGADACFGFIVDKEVAAAAHAAGVGAQINISLGGKTDQLHGTPIEATAYVKALSDGKLILQHMGKGSRLHLGPLCRLVINNMDVVVGSRRSQTLDKEPFLAVGIEVERYRYVALKSSNHFRAAFQSLASTIITADPPGLSTHQLQVFPRQQTNLALWPIDANASFTAADAAEQLEKQRT